MLQCIAVCCSDLQCVAVTCSVLQCAAVCCNVLQCAAVCCSELQCAAVRCSVAQCAAVCCSVLQCGTDGLPLQVFFCRMLLMADLSANGVAVCCSVLQMADLAGLFPQTVLQCAAVCCSVLQCVADGLFAGLFPQMVLQCAAVCCCVLLCVADGVCCRSLSENEPLVTGQVAHLQEQNTMQHIATHCSATHICSLLGEYAHFLNMRWLRLVVSIKL